MPKEDVASLRKRLDKFKMKEAVRRARSSNQDYKNINNERYYGRNVDHSPEGYVTEGLSRADYLIKQKKFGEAVDTLYKAYANLDELSRYDRDKYEEAIKKRSLRIANGVLNEKGGTSRDAEYAINLISRIETDNNPLNKSKKKSLETSFGFISLAGLLASLFFLSSNFTGNIIGANQQSYNIIGMTLFVIAVISGIFYLYKKSK